MENIKFKNKEEMLLRLNVVINSKYNNMIARGIKVYKKEFLLYLDVFVFNDYKRKTISELTSDIFKIDEERLNKYLKIKRFRKEDK